MVERRVCTFCGDEIEPGTGRMYIKKDGVVFNFCSSKCFKNLVVLGRVPRRTTWTRYYEREKQMRTKGQPAAPKPAAAKKLRKGGEVAKKEAKPEEEPAPEKKEEAPKKEPAPKSEKKPAAPKVRTVKKSADGSKKEPEKKPPEEKE
jgi:large subunit ribosomal protein L24e